MVGSGITPEDVDIRQLSDLLAATAATLEALAKDSGSPVSLPSLKTIRRGSAVAVLWSPEPVWPEQIRQFHDVVETRAAGASEPVRSAVQRLYRSVRVGAIRVGASDLQGGKHLAPIIMAAPLEVVPRLATYTTTFYGRVVAVSATVAGKIVVKIEHVDGGREDFACEASVAERAARLFNRTIRAEVEMSWDGDDRRGLSLRDLKPWNEIDFVDSLIEARAELQARGVTIDIDEALKEIDG